MGFRIKRAVVPVLILTSFAVLYLVEQKVAISIDEQFIINQNNQHQQGQQQHVASQERAIQHRNQIKEILPTDAEYIKYPWNRSPIVIEKYKLIFYATPKVACSAWKTLFLRMMGQKDWRTKDVNAVPNGIKRLVDYSIEQASEYMASPEWTRAIFVRDPLERFLSAYLDKGARITKTQQGRRSNFISKQCCKRSPRCVNQTSSSPEGFFKIAKRCRNNHWNPQSSKISPKFLDHIDFVGQFSNIMQDSERLLRQIGAWEEFGRSGWGENKAERIFNSSDGRSHATHAKEKLRKYLSPSLQTQLVEFYYEDYENSLFNFSLPKSDP
mmetsp:Transcript_4257/g.5610  ORF Transcript_4257/g.5610 Transcript_4257/m.5610 type:complete len:326 (+) Transcript_4257:121-1098(+)